MLVGVSAQHILESSPVQGRKLHTRVTVTVKPIDWWCGGGGRTILWSLPGAQVAARHTRFENFTLGLCRFIWCGEYRSAVKVSTCNTPPPPVYATGTDGGLGEG
jgi:hypothetical protein